MTLLVLCALLMAVTLATCVTVLVEILARRSANRTGHATGNELDALARQIGLKRKRLESDERLRARCRRELDIR